MAVSSWCRAVGWRLSCYGRQVFSARVSKHYMFSPLALAKFFYLKSVLVQIHLGITPSAPTEQRSCLEPVLARALAPACVARQNGICTFANSNCVLVRRAQAPYLRTRYVVLKF
jgi:hypothetical protein